MKKIIILIIVFVIISTFISLAALNKPTGKLTGSVIQNYDRTFTKAICNPNDECIDILIYCKDKETVKLELSSKLVKLSKDLDITKEEFENLCG